MTENQGETPLPAEDAPPVVPRAVNADCVETEYGSKLYGLDAELYRKMAEKFDPLMEEQAREWIESVLGEKIIDENHKNLFEAIRSGVLLCRLANAIKPGAIPRINPKANHVMERDNIKLFLRACQDVFHVPSSDLFAIADLHAKKNWTLVVNSLHSFGSYVQLLPGYDKPKLGKAPDTDYTERARIAKEKRRKEEQKNRERIEAIRHQQATRFQRRAAKSSGHYVDWAAAARDPNSIESLFQEIASEISEKGVQDERILNAIKIIKQNRLMKKVDLKGHCESELFSWGIPLRILRIFKKKGLLHDQYLEDEVDEADEGAEECDERFVLEEREEERSQGGFSSSWFLVGAFLLSVPLIYLQTKR